ncbi:MAG: ABC transporter permease [Spirochaetales bacterium]|nr:ABC transporter permease [Spirochaetales bacterium]
MRSLLLDMSYRLFKGPRKRETRPIIGSITGIALSMIPLVVVIFLSDGMIRGITERYIETGTFHIQLRPYEEMEPEEWSRISRELENLDSVSSTVQEHSGTGMAYSGEKQTALTIRAVERDLYETDPGFRRYVEMVDGVFDLSDDNKIVIGRETASALNLKPGDTMRVLTGKTLSTGKYIPKVSRFTVTGVFSTGYQDLDRMWVFISLPKGLRILQDSESRTMMALKVVDPYSDMNPVISEIRGKLGAGRWGIYSWHSLNRSQQSNYETTKLLLVLIMALIVLVAVMNISSSMIMLVMENEQEIGILKSMGMNNRFLSFQYVLTAGLAGGSGSLMGITAGSLIVLNFNRIISSLNGLVNFILGLWNTMTGRISTGAVSLLNSEYYLEDFTITLDVDILILIFFSTLILSMAAALLPVRNIGKISPLDILRKH